MIAAGSVSAGAAGVIAVALIAGGTQNLSNDRLDQATTPASEASISPRPAPSRTAQAPPAAAPQASPTEVSTAAPAASSPPPGPIAAATAAPITKAGDDAGDTARPPAYRTPEMVRTRSTNRTAPAGASFCAQHQGDDSSGVQSRVNWCVDLRVEPIRGVQRLSLAACRDDTGPGTLTYRDAFETDFAILDRQEREVWRWSAGRSSDGPEHVLDVAAGDCVTWSVDWTGVDSRGRRLPPGDYTTVSTTFADELANLPNEKRTFSLR